MPEAIQTIDLKGVFAGDAGALERAASALRGPCESLGVFNLVGHGIPDSHLREFEQAMHTFFALPDETKAMVRRTRDNAWGFYDEELTKNRPDWKQVFDFGREQFLEREKADSSGGASTPGETSPQSSHSDGVNQWPEDHPDLRSVLLRHHAHCERVARMLLRALSVSLGFAADRLLDHFEADSSFVRLNYYPPCPDPAPPDATFFPENGQLGVHHHSDAGAFTLLYQDAVPGLQVLRDDTFEIVAPVAGALTVNLGDMLRVWSNDRFASPIHRVIAQHDRPRYSAPFFFNPRYDTVCEPILEGSCRNDPSRFAPVSWAHFRDQRSAGDFADYGSEIQVEDYRLADGA